ncbi:hypothetical protein K9M42_02560 [Patescibacteria group bacterium]|nr:hypothetical protein [Patescibacteria group bacterium]
MNKKEKLLLAFYLEECQNIYGGHRCNDVPDEYYKGWTKEEIEEFNHKLNLFNGISDKNDDDYVEDAYQYDWWILAYFAELIKKEAEDK